MKRHCLLVAVFASMALAGWSGDKEIIVESYSDGLNSEGFSNVDGRWAESGTKSTAPGLQATKAVYNDANTEAGTARFTPDIPVAGKYEVFMTYPLQGNASDIKYTVVSSDGTKDTTVTQFGRNDNHTPAPNTWFSLGSYNFALGKAGYVEVSDPLTGARPMASEPNARIYADAVKFVPVGFDLPADYVNKGKTGSTPDSAVAAVSTPAAVVSTPADMPGLPAVQAASAAGSGLPQLPAATPGLPTLPAATPGTPGLPALSAATPVVVADSALPSLPSGTPAAPALPSLPAVTPASAGLPALPASTPAAAGLPALPSATPAADAGLPSLPAAVTTPIPKPDLPSLAPVTPTPERRMPSPADTPVSGGVIGLPGGPLSNLPPLPGPGMPELPTGPLAVPPATAVPTPSATPAMPATMPTTPATPAPTPASGMSITQYNPSGLQWMYDFGAALNTARAQNKKVLVFFTATGNKVASVYETDYFNHPAVRQAMSNYVLMKVDFPKNTRLGYSLGIFGAGVIVVTDSVGDVTARIEQQPATPVELIALMAQDKPLRPEATDDAPVVSVTTGTDVTSAPVDAPAMPALPQ